MPPFTNKELYIMNGGNKQYIGRDGFMDVYNATAAEEAAWAKEVVASALNSIDTGNDATQIRFAVDNLLFHNYQGLEALLVLTLKNANPVKQIALANVLWIVYKYPPAFDIIMQNFQAHRQECIAEVFRALRDFKAHEGARKFLADCVAGDDEQLAATAKMIAGK